MADSASGSSKQGLSTHRRADAQRNIDKIIDTALKLYGQETAVSMSAIAKAAGISRVTLYGHFPSRTELAKAVVTKAVAETVAAMEEIDFDGTSADVALESLLRTQWHMFNRNRNLRENVSDDVAPQWLRRHHDPIFDRLDSILERGQQAGVFRAEIPRSWMVTVMYSLIHAAYDEISAGRLASEQVPGLLVDSLLAVLRTR